MLSVCLSCRKSVWFMNFKIKLIITSISSAGLRSHWGYGSNSDSCSSKFPTRDSIKKDSESWLWLPSQTPKPCSSVSWCQDFRNKTLFHYNSIILSKSYLKNIFMKQRFFCGCFQCFSVWIVIKKKFLIYCTFYNQDNVVVVQIILFLSDTCIGWCYYSNNMHIF